MEAPEFKQAREKALRYLARRMHSGMEVVRYLERKGFSAEVSRAAVRRLRASGLIDEEAYARSILRGRISGFPRGYRLLRKELFDKGIERDIVEMLMRRLEEEHPEEELARRALAKKTTRAVSKASLVGYLARRGFRATTIAAVTGDMDEE